MSKANDKILAKVVKNRQIESAMILGIVSAKNMGLGKPYDMAMSVKIALQNAGFQIVRKGN